MEKQTSYGKKAVLGLDQVFGAVLAVVLISVLLIIAIFMFDAIQDSFSNDIYSASNVTNDIVDEFGNYPELIGIIGVIVFLGLVIGVLVASFMFGARGGSGTDNQEEEEDDEDEDDEDDEDEDDEDDEDDDCEEIEELLQDDKHEPIVEESEIINTNDTSENRVVHKKW